MYIDYQAYFVKNVLWNHLVLLIKQMYRWKFESIIDVYTAKMKTKKARDIVKKRLAQQAFVQ